MATATVARPSQTLRARRDQPRPTLPTKRASGMDTTEPAAKRQKMAEPYVHTKDYILRKFAGNPPSLTLHLHQHHFRFDGGETTFPYDNPMAAFLKSLRKQEVPADMVEDLIEAETPFYDGCLIVEVHNHRSANGSDKGRHDSANGDQVKFSMHNYNNYVTPSGLVAFPKKAKESEIPEKAEAAKQEKSGDNKDKQDGPHIATLVMFPTALSRHKEIMMLARMPFSEWRKKRSTDDSVPPTPQAGRLLWQQDDKKALEQQELYQFEAEILLATEPPLYLEPVKNPIEAQRVLDMLKHPLHSEPPPSPKTRKRTTAELAADDAQAAEAERRMLIMDERKTTAPGAADTAGNSQALGLNRFKTLQMVREKLDEAERQKKEEQEQAQAQRKQEEAAASAAQAQKQAQAEQQRKLMNQRQHLARQQQEQMRQQQIQQAAALMAQNHAHPQQNGMMNQQQNNFANAASMAQSSPVVRQQTPMMNNSSPMVNQGGFPMAATSSQQAGSPPRPTSSAAMPNPNVAMARQASQQQHNSRNGTPQMAQGTPNMAGAMPNRQMNATPRMAQGSPAPGTPATASMNMASIPMQTPGQTNLSAEQYAMLQARLNMQNQGGMNAGSPGQNAGQNMTPEQIQQIQQQQHRARQQQIMMARAQAAAQQGGQMPQTQQALAQRAYLLQQQQQQQAMQQRMLQAQQQQNNAGQAGSPGSVQQTPQMGHAHPQGGQGQGDMNQGQQLTPQQQAMRQQQQQAQYRQAQLTVQNLLTQYGNLANIPQQVFQSLPPPVQMFIVNARNKQQQQQAQRAREMAMRAQQAQNAGQAVAGSTGGADPEYMQTLRNHQSMLAQQQQQGGQMNGMSMTHNMNFGNQQFGQQGNDNLSQQFQAMHAALNRSQQGGGGMGQ